MNYSYFMNDSLELWGIMNIINYTIWSPPAMINQNHWSYKPTQLSRGPALYAYIYIYVYTHVMFDYYRESKPKQLDVGYQWISSWISIMTWLYVVYELVWCEYDLICYDIQWHYMIWHAMIWHDMTWYDMICIYIYIYIWGNLRI